MNTTRTNGRATKRGSALIAALILISTLAILLLSMLAAGADGARNTNGQDDEWRLTSAAESVGALGAQHLWSGYVRSQGGAAGDVQSFRLYLDSIGIEDDGPGGPPPANAGLDLMPQIGLPAGPAGDAELDRMKVENVRVVRRDEGDSTHLFLNVAASTNRGFARGRQDPAKALRVVYTVEPAPFDGFDYGILTNNVNCVFCHTVIDSTERAYDTDPLHYGTFDKVKVGALQSIMLRSPERRGTITDFAADSLLAGALYIRGHATDQHGTPLSASAWNTHSARSSEFDSYGHLIQDASGGLLPEHFSPSPDPPVPGENLYVNYPTNYADQTDGLLPNVFPPPFPDDGGVDPVTGVPTSAGAGNKIVDPGEFAALANDADGAITSGIIYYSAPGATITTQNQYNRALSQGNRTTLPAVTVGNVVLSGTPTHPIEITGTVMVDGDVVIQGWIKGTGTILASGNVYMPGDLRYLDGHVYLPGDPPNQPSGPPTYGIAQDGTANTLGIAAGGNILMGDYLRPQSGSAPGPNDYVSGDAAGAWNFTIAEIALFNRGEWARTQPLLPGQGADLHDPATWHEPNPSYVPGYLPRYYHFGPGDEVPIYNLGNQYFDADTGTWHGDETAFGWDPDFLTIADPDDHSNPLLYDPATGVPRAAVVQVGAENGWLPDEFQKVAIEAFKNARPAGDPMRVDGLLYTNNAIFGIVPRGDRMNGKMVVNGAIVCADLGLLAPGKHTPGGADNVPGSPYSVGLRLNYDERTKGMLNVRNPLQVGIRRSLWRPTAAL